MSEYTGEERRSDSENTKERLLKLELIAEKLQESIDSLVNEIKWIKYVAMAVVLQLPVTSLVNVQGLSQLNNRVNTNSTHIEQLETK